jgi:hypothetical protein
MNLVNSVGNSVSGVQFEGGKGGFSGSRGRGDNGASGNYGSRDGSRESSIGESSITISGSVESSITVSGSGESITISGSGKAIS